ncbi:MAG TPA: hypothetical protein VJH55_02435 [Candidatus Paceibacterota bacterium]
MRILFIDDRVHEVVRQWKLSGCGKDYFLIHPEAFISASKTREMVEKQQPDVVVVGYGLGKIGTTGADVIRVLRGSNYAGFVVGNSGDPNQFILDGVELDGMANRNPETLKSVLDNLKERNVV